MLSIQTVTDHLIEIGRDKKQNRTGNLAAYVSRFQADAGSIYQDLRTYIDEILEPNDAGSYDVDINGEIITVKDINLTTVPDTFIDFYNTDRPVRASGKYQTVVMWATDTRTGREENILGIICTSADLANKRVAQEALVAYFYNESVNVENDPRYISVDALDLIEEHYLDKDDALIKQTKSQARVLYELMDENPEDYIAVYLPEMVKNVKLAGVYSILADVLSIRSTSNVLDKFNTSDILLIKESEFSKVIVDFGNVTRENANSKFTHFDNLNIIGVSLKLSNTNLIGSASLFVTSPNMHSHVLSEPVILEPGEIEPDDFVSDLIEDAVTGNDILNFITDSLFSVEKKSHDIALKELETENVINRLRSLISSFATYLGYSISERSFDESENNEQIRKLKSYEYLTRTLMYAVLYRQYGIVNDLGDNYENEFFLELVNFGAGNMKEVQFQNLKTYKAFRINGAYTLKIINNPGKENEGDDNSTGAFSINSDRVYGTEIDMYRGNGITVYLKQLPIIYTGNNNQSLQIDFTQSNPLLPSIK